MEDDIFKIAPSNPLYKHTNHSVGWSIISSTIGYKLICDHRKEGQCDVAEFVSSEFSSDEFVEGYIGPDETPLRNGRIKFTLDEDGIYWEYVADVSDMEDQ